MHSQLEEQSGRLPIAQTQAHTHTARRYSIARQNTTNNQRKRRKKNPANHTKDAFNFAVDILILLLLVWQFSCSVCLSAVLLLLLFSYRCVSHISETNKTSDTKKAERKKLLNTLFVFISILRSINVKCKQGETGRSNTTRTSGRQLNKTSKQMSNSYA